MPWMQSAGLTLLYFAVLISVLVFFHEMGHLLVGKLFNVKVLRFSIGFGPRLFGFQRGETEYRFSALPLGGYVKFAGDLPGEELEGADKGRGYLEQPPGRKAAIAFAGPAANFLLAAILFVAIHALPHADARPIAGSVKPGSPAALAGVQPGDLITAIDGERIIAWTEFQSRIRERGGQAVRMTVERDGKTLELDVVPAIHEETNPLETVRRGRIGIAFQGRKPAITVLQPQGPAARAGLQTFDTIARLDGKPLDTFEALEKELRRRAGSEVELDVLRRQPVWAPGGTLWSFYPVRLKLVAAAPADLGIEGADLTIFAVKPGSAAEAGGLRRGDRVLTVAGVRVGWWMDDVETLRRAAGARPLEMVVLRDGREVKLTVRQTLRTERDEAGVRQQVPELGAEPDENIFASNPQVITVRWPLSKAVVLGLAQMVDQTRGMMLGIAKIVTGNISREAIGGPIMIADVARQAADAGPLAYLLVMGVISISLGLMNLIPIPVLDGFHILSAGIEAVRRRPLPLRFREIANLVGVAMVLTLMLFALKNDIVRKFFE